MDEPIPAVAASATLRSRVETGFEIWGRFVLRHRRVVVMLALLVGSSLGGIWGMLLAIPVTATLNVVGIEWLSIYKQSQDIHGIGE